MEPERHVNYPPLTHTHTPPPQIQHEEHNVRRLDWSPVRLWPVTHWCFSLQNKQRPSPTKPAEVPTVISRGSWACARELQAQAVVKLERGGGGATKSGVTLDPLRKRRKEKFPDEQRSLSALVLEWRRAAWTDRRRLLFVCISWILSDWFYAKQSST